jgi:hypothetical protein
MRLAGREHRAAPNLADLPRPVIPHLYVVLIAAAEARLPNRDDRHRHDAGCWQRRSSLARPSVAELRVRRTSASTSIAGISTAATSFRSGQPSR